MSKPTILLTPGPTPVPEVTRKLMAEPIFHHRTPRYRKIFGDVSERLKKVFLTKNPVYTFAGSGSLSGSNLPMYFSISSRNAKYFSVGLPCSSSPQS